MAKIEIAATARLALALVGVAAGHYCSSGERVKCLAVSSSNHAASTHGQGYGARGYPMCSPEGKKLFCLFDHDYHRCSDGYEPCCEDGSGPSHARDFSTNSAPDLDCAPEAISTTTRFPPIVLDDMDAAVVSDLKNIFPDASQCTANAHNGQFHHDGARNKGSALISFKFDPPADGCYALEEYHPTSPRNSGSCSRHFPQNARLDVDYCKGKSATLFIDQTANGAQWNEIAHFKFYKGHEGRLTMRSSESEKCEADSCFLAADAFRVTWKAASCHVLAKPGSTDDEAFNADKEGTLSLHLKFAAGHTTATIMPVLEIHQTGIAGVMAKPLGYKYVSIVSLTASARRLMETQGIKIHFGVQGKIGELNGESLLQALQTYLGTMVPGLTVLDAKVDWSDGIPEQETDWVKLIVFISASLVALSLACFAVWKCRATGLLCSPKQKEHVESKGTAIKAIVDVEKASEKIGKDEIDDTASTGTPDSSQQATSEESESKQGDDTAEIERIVLAI